MFSNIRKKINDVCLKNLPPSLFLKYRELRKKGYEPEFELLPFLCDNHKISVDIGANLGSYTSRLTKYSQTCWAFEPVPKLAKFLRRAFGDKIIVKEVALSSKSGKAELVVPKNVYAFSTLEKDNSLENHKEIEKILVEVRRLDDYDLKNVGFIKIDVEGHEEEVLKGALNTLKNSKPILLIELEERHRSDAVHSARKFLEGIGYKGFFFSQGRLIEIEQFKTEIHQKLRNPEKVRNENKKGHYVNNFIFLTEENLKKVSRFLN